MPDPGTPLDRLLAGLKRALGAVILVDDEPWSAQRVLKMADQLASTAGKGQRIACLAENPAIIAASLIAAQRQGHDLLLVRARAIATGDFLARLGIAAVIESDGQMIARAGDRQPGHGYVLLMTSGTTGTPKIATHRLTALMDRITVSPDNDPAACWLLTYHPASFAGMQMLLTSLVSGVALVATLQSGIAALVATAKRHKITFASGTPTFWRGFLTACGNEAGKIPLRIVTLGGEVADQPTLDRLRCVWPQAKLVHIYASTEGGAVFAVKDGRAGFPTSWLAKGVDGYQLRLRDGMLEIKGPRVMQGYEGAASPMAEDWLKTGDLCTIEGDRVGFTGRHDSVINVGGAKVSPETVEAALLRLPYIRDVRVFGRRNPVTGMLVVAEIVLASDTENPDTVRKAVLDHARTILQPFEVPQILTFVPQLTATVTAKKVRQ
jgi:acyl-coenzyme A synthetase/AMP-(fatty) acid ligase